MVPSREAACTGKERQGKVCQVPCTASESQMSLGMTLVKSSGCLHMVARTQPRNRLECRSRPRGYIKDVVYAFGNTA